MYNRYRNTREFVNNNDQYSDIFYNKKVNFIKQFSSFSFGNLKEGLNIDRLDYIVHKVSFGDRLYNISQKYYNSPEFGWIICYTNGLSSELNIKVDDTLLIFIPLEVLLELFNGS